MKPNTPYLIAIVSMLFVALTCITAITLYRPEQDLAIIIAATFGFITPTTLSLLSFMKAQETHLSVNSRLDEFIRNAREASHAEGVVRGTREANDRTDKLASTV